MRELVEAKVGVSESAEEYALILDRMAIQCMRAGWRDAAGRVAGLVLGADHAPVATWSAASAPAASRGAVVLYYVMLDEDGFVPSLRDLALALAGAVDAARDRLSFSVVGVGFGLEEEARERAQVLLNAVLERVLVGDGVPRSPAPGALGRGDRRVFAYPPPPCESPLGAQRRLGRGMGKHKGREQGRADRARRNWCRAQKEAKERAKGIIAVVRKPPSGKSSCRCTHHRAQVSAGVGKPDMDSEGASGCTGSTARATAPSLGRPTPGVVKQDKSSRGSVDTTKTRSGPQRVRRSSGDRPIGAPHRQTNQHRGLVRSASTPAP